jgi:hypothetical protein
MDAEQLERIRSARNNFERIATQGSSDAGIMEVIITHLPPELRQRTIEFAEHLRSVSDGAAELVIQLDQVNGVGSRVPGNVKKGAMHAATRTYSGKGAVELIDFIEKNKAEVERLIRSIDGFASFTLVRTGSGGFTVSVFSGQDGDRREHPCGAGVDQSERGPNRSCPTDCGRGNGHPAKFGRKWEN